MAEYTLVKDDEVQIKHISLGKIIDAFNGPLNEEQAWSLCHQSAKFLGQSWCNDGEKMIDFDLSGVGSVWLRKDGTVTIDEQEVPGDSTVYERWHHFRERELVDALGRVIYQSLDFGFHPDEERELSHSLEILIDSMTISEDTDTNVNVKHSNDTLNSDEGIEDGNCSDEEEFRRQANDGKLTTFDKVLEACRRHIPDPAVAPNHYQAVCRALVNEVQELTTFLQRVSSSKQTIRVFASGEDETDGKIENLQPREWARIWMMVLQNLRHGVTLKKVCTEEINKASIEYELTPYEILMDDIRSRRYQLNKIMVDGDIPPKIKKEAHDIILDFIRSRPPLRPVRCHSWSDTKLMDRLGQDRQQKITRHERMLLDIRAQPKLMPVSQRVLAKKPKFPRRRRRFGSEGRDSGSVSSDVDSEDLDSLDDSPELPKRKLKAEVILDWSDDDDMLDTVTIPSVVPTQQDLSFGEVFEPPVVQNNMYVYPERPKDIKPSNLPPKRKPTIMPKPPSKKLSVINMPSIESDPGTPDSPLPAGVTSGMAVEDVFPIMENFLDGEEDEKLSPLVDTGWILRESPRRHSIGMCETQKRRMRNASTPKGEYYRAPAFLSLTVDEVIHIRSVLIKAELENLRVSPKLYHAVAKEKVCFSCKNKFAMFKKKIRCKLCKRLVCSVCSKKVLLPRGHFLQIPVDALSPDTPTRRRQKKQQSAYRGPETAEKFRSLSEPPTPSISPIRIPKFWRVENRQADAKEDVCVMCDDFLMNALKAAQKTPTPTPNRTPNRTPTDSGHSTPTRKFSLGPAPYPPLLQHKLSMSSQSTEKESLSAEMEAIPDDLEFEGSYTDTMKASDSEAESTDAGRECSVPEERESTTLVRNPAEDAQGIAGKADNAGEDNESEENMKPWGVNNDDEELEILCVHAARDTQTRIPYVI